MSRDVPLLLRLAVRLLPEDTREEILGDLLEHWRHEVGARPRSGRMLWLMRQPLVAMSLRSRYGRGGRRDGPTKPGPPGGLVFSWLDVKLGLRMLRRNPGMTIVSVFALSIGVPASLIPVHGIEAMGAPLPFDEGDRIVGIRNRDVVERRPDLRSLHDFFVWRDGLTTVEAVGATRGDAYNLIAGDGRPSPVQGAEITASGFRILRVPPLMGRVLLESDEVPGAPDVVVVSHELWQSRLGGDPDVLGTTIDLGTKPHQVVGVMPEGFLFPWRDDVWLPLRYRPSDFERGQGPEITVFGRLAEGASIDDARTELERVGARLARAYPDTHGRLRPQVRGYTEMVSGIDGDDRAAVWLTELFALALLMIVCGNVGTLMLARTATRSGEIAVRTALGASRGRIVSQLFVESLVLAVCSTGLGLLLGDVLAARFQGDMPMLQDFFWLDLGVKPRTVVVALSVAALCAVVSGVLPALRATGRGVRVNLQGATAGSGMRFGRASTLLIVGQVALAVGFLTLGGTLTYALVTSPRSLSDIDADEYLMVLLTLPGTDPASARDGPGAPELRDRVAAAVTGLRDRLSEEPGVLGVAMGSSVPEMDHRTGRVEVEGEDGGAAFAGRRVRRATVDVGFFEGLGHEVLNGRGFTTSDLAGRPGEDRTAVIVNTAFVEHVLGGRNPIGRRVRYVVPAGREPGPWYEIVGVVGHLGMNALSPARDEGLYHPAAPGELHPVWMAIRLGEDPLAFVPRLRRIAGEVDPEAMIQYPRVLSDAPNLDRTVNLYGYMLLVFLCGTAIVLSGAGLYALMSFTVSQRTREIGIRTALGARPERILVAVGRRTFFQLAAGIVAGAAVGLGLLYALREANIPGPDPAATLAACSGFMLLVGMLACLEPTLRGLRIQPVEALKEG